LSETWVETPRLVSQTRLQPGADAVGPDTASN